MKIKDFFEMIIDKLYPSDITCLFCGEEVNKSDNCLCDKCENKLLRNDKVCLKCGSPLHSMAEYCLTCKANKRTFDLARAPLIYMGGVAVAVQNLKYDGRKYLAKPMAKFMAKEYEKIKKQFGAVDIIIPVPLFKDRQKKRGYNQSQLLAEQLSKLISVQVVKNNLIRIRDTKTQTALNFKERQENLNDAFKVVDKNILKNKVVLLLDDVFTTGSTAEHCSIALKKAKVKKIFVLTFATTDSDKT